MAYDFKKEEDVKQFLENLLMEYRFGCYSEKNPEVCHLLGDYFDNIDKDFEKAAKLYQTSCDEYQYPRSCYRYGAYALVGKGKVKQSLKTAHDYFEKGCNLNCGASCLQQGLLLTENNTDAGVKMDALKGMELLEKSCMLKYPKSCYYACGFYIGGVKKPEIKATDIDRLADEDSYIVKQDFKKAFTYAVEGCNMRDLYCCVNLSQMYKRGDGVEKNPELALKYRKIVSEIKEEMTSNKTLKFGQGLPD